MIPLQHRLDIEPRSSAENGHLAPTPDVLISIEEVLLILKEVVLRARLPDIYQMIRYQIVVKNIVSQVLTRADIHPTVHLPGVG